MELDSFFFFEKKNLVFASNIPSYNQSLDVRFVVLMLLLMQNRKSPTKIQEKLHTNCFGIRNYFQRNINVELF